MMNITLSSTSNARRKPSALSRHVHVLLRDSVPLWAVLDLNHSESDRYPSQDRKYLCMGHSLPFLFRVEGAQFAASLLLYLRGLSD